MEKPEHMKEFEARIDDLNTTIEHMDESQKMRFSAIYELSKTEIEEK